MTAQRGWTPQEWERTPQWGQRYVSLIFCHLGLGPPWTGHKSWFEGHYYDHCCFHTCLIVSTIRKNMSDIFCALGCKDGTLSSWILGPDLSQKQDWAFICTCWSWTWSWSWYSCSARMNWSEKSHVWLKTPPWAPPGPFLTMANWQWGKSSGTPKSIMEVSCMKRSIVFDFSMYELVRKVSSCGTQASPWQKLHHVQVWKVAKNGNVDLGPKRDSKVKSKVIFVFSMYELIKWQSWMNNKNPNPSVRTMAS